MAKKFTVNLSDDLYEAMELLRQRRKYRPGSEYLAALIRYDGQTQREHSLTTEWAALSPTERDMLDANILALVKSGKGQRGSWLEATIVDIVKAELSRGNVPEKRQVAAELAKRIAQTNEASKDGKNP